MEDFPRILKLYEKLLPALKPHQQYMGVATVVQSVEDAQILMRMQMNAYEKIYKAKGIVTNEE